MEHGLKDIAFYVKKAYNTLHSCHNFPAGLRQAARGARICETSLLNTSNILGFKCYSDMFHITNAVSQLDEMDDMRCKKFGEIVEGLSRCLLTIDHYPTRRNSNYWTTSKSKKHLLYRGKPA